MGKKKPQLQNWPEAIRLCRLNQNDVEMAKRLGFRPGSLIRARPNKTDRWKAPVNEWVRDLYYKKYHHVIGEKPVLVAPPVEIEIDEDAARRFEEELYWDDYWDRNQEDTGPKKPKGKPKKLAKAPAAVPGTVPNQGIVDDSVPF
jgi:hypothetical protein